LAMIFRFLRRATRGFAMPHQGSEGAELAMQPAAELLPVVYAELRRMARQLRDAPDGAGGGGEGAPPPPRSGAGRHTGRAGPRAQRPAFLEAACAHAPALRAEVESLLACDADFPEGAGDDGVLKSPLVRAPEPTNSGADEPLPAAWSPRSLVRIGRYRILRR